MSTTEAPPAARAPAATYPTPARPGDDRFVSLAAEVGAVAAAHADAHDRDATFVSEAYDAMRTNGYLRLAVPEDLGGLGASIRQVCYAQAELARHDGATALAVAMHMYLTLMQAFRRRQGAADAEAVLRRVAEEGLVIATSGETGCGLAPATASSGPRSTLVVLRASSRTCRQLSRAA